MSLRLSVLNALLRLTVKPVIARAGRPDMARRHLEIITRIFLHGPKVSAQSSVLNGVPVVTFTPSERTTEGTVLYFHGGGYIAGSPATHKAMLSVLAVETGCRVLAPDYRLAPDHPFPAAFEDAQSVMAALDPATTVLGGDSAGGGLALALLADLMATGATPAGLFAFAPWTDLAARGASLAENAARDVLLPARRFPELVEMVLAGADPKDPRISPLYADFRGAPPVHLEVAESEILRDDTLRLAERLADQGATVTTNTLAHAPHVWQMLVGLVPEARASLVGTAAFVRERLKSPSH